jgi:NADH-quinone oxidoreductase subunit A
MTIITIFVKSGTFTSSQKPLMLYYAEYVPRSTNNTSTQGVLREVRMLEYVAIALMIVLATAVALIAIGLGTILGPKKESEAKSMPYESGMNPIGEGTRRMPVRFYLIAVLFILFDIEVVFFLPWAVVFRQLRIFGLIEMAVFIAILLVGYVYAWKKGALEWE